VCLPRQQHRPARAPSTRFALAEPSADFFRIPLLGEPPRWRRPISCPDRRPQSRFTSDISLVETKEVTPVSPALNKPLRQAGFDPYAVRREFPILNERVNGRRLVWLDNAATTQKPQTVIDRLSYFYAHENPTFTGRPTPWRPGQPMPTRMPEPLWPAFWARPAHETSCSCAGPPRPSIWWRRPGAGNSCQPATRIVITHLEHHANIVPWQQLCAKTGARLLVARSTIGAR